MAQPVSLTVVFAVTVACASVFGTVDANYDVDQENVPRLEEKDMDVEKLKQSVLKFNQMLIDQYKKINKLTKQQETSIAENAFTQELTTKKVDERNRCFERKSF
ncbi:hypothetical protein DPMN_113866 [Dreissena polymorpha]|uniref:Uncharacterized protein n=1 Tax=Dreissena polymorpha TaxID=45954 RepID=A0A9D4QRF3_DREPO|nr:hypothetical protein DPMN_113866 [Dreissena polymorpha]